MCGIAGILSCNGAPAVDEGALRRMSLSVANRGPDAEGVWLNSDHRIGLAHRRLSIVDHSPNAAQPLFNEDRTISVICNGEIYNSQRLRRRLLDLGHLFRTHHSDTEVLVHGYEEWGPERLTAEISGEYAIAIWNENSGVLTLLRDHAGIKPIFFSYINNTFLFGSELKVILSHPFISREVSVTSVSHYLTFLATPAPLTMCSKVYKVPAGFILQVNRQGQLNAHSYWNASCGLRDCNSEATNYKSEYFSRRILTELTQSVNERLSGDVSTGILLSGGLDSSAILGLARRQTSKTIYTFTVGFEEPHVENEFSYAAETAKYFSSCHQEIRLGLEDVLLALPKILSSLDEPLADPGSIPAFFAFAAAREANVPTIQVGEGADEQFCGYRSYERALREYAEIWLPFITTQPHIFQPLIAGGAKLLGNISERWRKKADLFDRALNGHEHFWSGAIGFWGEEKRSLFRIKEMKKRQNDSDLDKLFLLPEERDAIPSAFFASHYESSLRASVPSADLLASILYKETRLRLPELLLMRVDRMSMAHSIEARVPFMSKALLMTAMRVPMHLKTGTFGGKRLLKEALKGVLPVEVLRRKKLGLGAPIGRWLRGKMGHGARAMVLESRIFYELPFNRTFIDDLFQAHFAGKADHSAKLWALLMLTAWFDTIIDGKVIATW
jgi:asparagine synthase (glutamine-hydrolysing)